MILTFSDKRFPTRIINRQKTHTVRYDPQGRWHPGREIHYWMHNPRNKEKNPFHFATGTVEDVASIALEPKRNKIWLTEGWGDTKEYDPEKFAKNDGFDSVDEMWAWFHRPVVMSLIYFADDIVTEEGIFQKLRKVS